MYKFFGKNFLLRLKRQNYYLPIHILVILLFTIIYKLISDIETSKVYINNNIRKSVTNQTWEEILYFSVVTHFTIGFGDIVPKTKLMRRATICHILIAFTLFNL